MKSQLICATYLRDIIVCSYMLRCVASDSLMLLFVDRERYR
jgi:hypothetical protein